MPGLDRIVVVGASLAGLRAAEALRRHGFSGELVIVGAEPHRPYNRPPLSKRYLTADLGEADLALPPVGDPQAHWVLGSRATGIDPARRRVILDRGHRELRYDGLVIATGAYPRPLPGSRTPNPGMHLLRSLDDARTLRAALAARPRHVLVIGGGFVGSEVASTARQLGLVVTVVDGAALPLAAALGSQVAGWLADQHRAHGIRTRYGTQVLSLEGRPGEMRATLACGETITADLVVVGLGAVPNTDWLAGSGLRVDNGVVADAALFAAGADDVVVAGDVARYPHPLGGAPVRIEHWSNAVDTARVAAANLLAGRAAASPVAEVPTFWTDQHCHKIQSVGLPELATESALIEGPPEQGQFVVGFGRAGVLVGAVAVNSPRRLPALRRAIADHVPYPYRERHHDRAARDPAGDSQGGPQRAVPDQGSDPVGRPRRQRL